MNRIDAQTGLALVGAIDVDPLLRSFMHANGYGDEHIASLRRAFTRESEETAMAIEVVYRMHFGGPLLWTCRTTYDDGRVSETFMLAPKKPAWRR